MHFSTDPTLSLKQVEELEKAKETLTALQRPELDDCQLLEILRGKDSHIVGLESTLRDKQRESDLQEHEVTKLKAELKTYQDLFEAKDESIVRLTNKVHELELDQVRDFHSIIFDILKFRAKIKRPKQLCPELKSKQRAQKVQAACTTGES